MTTAHTLKAELSALPADSVVWFDDASAGTPLATAVQAMDAYAPDEETDYALVLTPQWQASKGIYLRYTGPAQS